ncbi:MAG: hypothetical protein AAF297_02995 [Planctomycetota bacterium]
MTTAPRPSEDSNSWLVRVWRDHLDRSPINQSFRLIRRKPVTWQRLLAEADLPAAIEGQIDRIARKTRVMPFEKATFVAELIGHCQDGLDAGVEPDQVARSMGPPTKVGKLAARAIKRKRPVIIRSLSKLGVGVQRTAVALISTYAVLSIWFWSRSPIIETDYLAVLTAETAAPAGEVGQAQKVLAIGDAIRELRNTRAAELGFDDINSLSGDVESYWVRGWPDIDVLVENTSNPDPHEDEQPPPADPAGFVGLVDRARPIIEQAREAGVTERLDPRWERAGDAQDVFEQTLVATLLPYLGEYRQTSFLLTADALIAAGRGDADRATESIIAITGLAQTLQREDPFLISQFVSWALLRLAYETTLALLHDHPDLLAAEQLDRLRAAVEVELSTTLAGERLAYMDVVQHAYARGDHGRLTPDGVRLLQSLDWTFKDALDISDYFDGANLVNGPVVAPFLASRRETLDRNARMSAAYEHAARTPVISPSHWREVQMIMDQLESARDPVFNIMAPTITRALNSLQTLRTYRDATRITLAAFAYRAENGAYPDTVDQLMPMWLPTVPVDRYDGQPMRYVLTPDGPLVYTVAADRIDQEGVRPDADSMNRWGTGIRSFDPDTRHADTPADWVLFPPEDSLYAPLREWTERDAN